MLFFMGLSAVAGSFAGASLEEVQTAAASGNPDAQCNLGLMYHEGRGVARDMPKGLEWTRKAAEAGVPAAQSNLGYWLFKGMGVPKDVRQGVMWLERAARQGNAWAQAELGWILGEGKEVPKNQSASVEWTRKAALQGEPTAMNNLGYDFNHGKGVPRNHVEAYVWSTLAAARGNTLAPDSVNFARQRMTTRQIQEADRRIAAFKPLTAAELWPVIRIDNVVVEPATLPGGTPFALKVDMQLTDPRTIEEQLTPDLSFEIVKDDILVFVSRPKRCQVANGRPARLVLAGLPSTQTKGRYELQARVEYGPGRARRTVPFAIE